MQRHMLAELQTVQAEINPRTRRGRRRAEAEARLRAAALWTQARLEHYLPKAADGQLPDQIMGQPTNDSSDDARLYARHARRMARRDPLWSVIADVWDVIGDLLEEMGR